MAREAWRMAKGCAQARLGEQQSPSLSLRLLTQLLPRSPSFSPDPRSPKPLSSSSSAHRPTVAAWIVGASSFVLRGNLCLALQAHSASGSDHDHLSPLPRLVTPGRMSPCLASLVFLLSHICPVALPSCP